MITVERAQKHLEAWLDAELAVTTGQSYSIGSRSLTRANLAEIRKQIDYWRNRLDEAKITERGGKIKRARRFIPRDL